MAASGADSDAMENVTADGLVRKRVLQPGSGDAAGRGAKVNVHYTLYKGSEDDEDGVADADKDTEIIDSSTEGRPLAFTTGRKKVIPALDAAVETMAAGEHARVYAAAAYAYGAKGLRRKGIAPNTDVRLDVELLSFEGGVKRKSLADMCARELFEQALTCKEAGNALFKQVKFEKAMMQYSQCIRLVNNVQMKKEKNAAEAEEAAAKPAPLEEETGASTEEQADEEAAQEGDVAQAAQGEEEIANGFNEASIIDVGDNAGEGAASATLEVEQQEEEKKDEEKEEEKKEEEEEEEEIVTVDATDGGKVINGDMNGEVSHVEEAAAADSNEAVGSTEAHEPEEVAQKEAEQEAEQEPVEEEQADPDDEEVTALKVTALNNLSLCLVKLEDFKRAAESASAALQLDPDNSKGHYYRGRALVALGEWELARDDLVKAAKLQPNNMGIRMEITKLDKKRKSFQNLERKQAAAMFA